MKEIGNHIIANMPVYLTERNVNVDTLTLQTLNTDEIIYTILDTVKSWFETFPSIRVDTANRNIDTTLSYYWQEFNITFDCFSSADEKIHTHLAIYRHVSPSSANGAGDNNKSNLRAFKNRLSKLFLYDEKEEGCWLDGSRGIYIGEAVIETAIDHGWNHTKAGYTMRDAKPKSDHYNDMQNDAENYLQQFAADGFYFGNHPDWGDWGLYKSFAEQETQEEDDEE